jgi:N-acetylated-alpha-linked acidic dipeptidase
MPLRTPAARTPICLALLALVPPAAAAGPLPEALRDALIAGPDPEQLGLFHSIMASEPHDAGTPGDATMIDNLAGWFESFGLEVERHELHLYLSTPVSASVEILPSRPGDAVIELPVREAPVEGDPFSAQDDLRPGWNAYAGSGVVEGEVVYANYGRLEDFRRLEALGVETEGKVILARYGGNYRGYKAKYAEEAGAAGLVIFTDPADSGWGRGLPYPEGGYANETHIQRGSIKTLPYYGDPLTPFVEATENAERLDPSEVGLPTIPVQPVPWKAAQQILERMTGAEVPGGWQGGLPMRYRLTGGADLRLRVAVEQTRDIVKTANVLGTLRGSTHPDEVVLIGCHHDAWGFGAGDPTAGLMCVAEAARVFGEMAKNGWRPARSIVFAGWAAEEHGIVGSVEYVESRPDWLTDNAVAYLNLDMAAMGTNFGSSASPSLRPVIVEAAGMLEQPGLPGTTVLEHWIDRSGEPTMPGMPRFGHLGGGSDHVGFLCHVCVPSASLGGGGSRGVSYHSMYDNLSWYRAVVGDDYAAARMVTQMTLLTAAMLADAPVPGLDPTMYTAAVREQLDQIEQIHADRGDGAWGEVFGEVHPAVRAAGERFEAAALSLRQAALRAESGPALTEGEAESIRRLLREIERSWCDERFDDGRPWYRNGFAAPDATSGYAAWILPGLRAAMHEEDPDRYRSQALAYARWFIDQTERLSAVLE